MDKLITAGNYKKALSIAKILEELLPYAFKDKRIEVEKLLRLERSYYLALRYRSKSDLDNAIDHFRRVVSVDPFFKDAAIHLAESVRRKRLNDYSKTINKKN
ncbi:MAG: hypothetical protein QNK37_04510 [Acidobacteriota bacterium]|nr:hypothetical protein [Acidobacteriota bacterium]